MNGKTTTLRKGTHKGRPYTLLTLWLPVLLWAGVIFYLSSVPNLRVTEAWWDYPLRKAGHMAVFGILARLLARALGGSTFWPWRKIFVVSLVLTSLYAVTDELHQSYTPGRHAAASDVMIDTLGGWIALGLWP